MNDQSMIAQARSTSNHRAGNAGWIVRRLYTGNPFYVVSAELVFVGLRTSFPMDGDVFKTWILTLCLAAYTLLLAITACLLIRLGRVWDDVRSVLLLVVMMFLAISVTLDDALASRPRLGIALALAGFLFAAAVTEGVLRGIRLALPALFRVPYYLILAIFFFYPLILIPVMNQPNGATLQWALFGFSPVAGLVFLTLLPAIRRGATYVEGNGSPWPWPLYPWVLFGLLGLAACARSYYLCISMHFVERSALNVSRTSSIFGLYFLVPLLYALLVLLLEFATRSRKRPFAFVLLSMPLVLSLVLSWDTPDNIVALRFRGLFEHALGGTPFSISLLAAAIFYGYACLRRMAFARDFLTLTLGLEAFVSPTSTGFHELSSPNIWPLLVAGGFQILLAAYESRSWRAAVGLLCWGIAGLRVLPHAETVGESLFMAAHLGLAASLALGLAYQDAVGWYARRCGIFLIMLTSGYAAFGDPPRVLEVLPQGQNLYFLFAVAVALGYGTLVRDRGYYVAASVSAASWLTSSGWRSYSPLRQLIVGLDLIVCGLASFFIAASISVRKAGGFRKWSIRRTPDHDFQSEIR